jgi:hypothetical protein
VGDEQRGGAVRFVASVRLDAAAQMMSASKGLPYPGGFLLRGVHSANDLREKSLIFDNDLDDRTVRVLP